MINAAIPAAAGVAIDVPEALLTAQLVPASPLLLADCKPCPDAIISGFILGEI